MALLKDDRQNYLINGNFDLWQRGTSTSSIGYQADRWAQTVANTYSQQSGGPNDVSKYFARISGSGSLTLQQRIEADNCRTMEDKLTIVLWAKSDVAGSPLTLKVDVPTVEDTFGTTTTELDLEIDTLTTSWAKYSYTFDLPSGARSRGLSVDIGDNTNAVAKQIDLAQVMLVDGDTVPPNFRRAGGSIGGELQLCQRYYEFGDVLRVSEIREAGGVTDDIAGREFKVVKRAIPSVSISSPAGDNTVQQWNAATNTAVSDVAGITERLFQGVTLSSNVNEGQRYSYIADAEL